MDPTNAVRTTCPYLRGGLRRVGATPAPRLRHRRRRLPTTRRITAASASKAPPSAKPSPWKNRLIYPELHGRRTTWDTALTKIATTLTETIAQHGPDSVALYVSGQLLTEDYYAANKFAKGFLGTANIDSNSRLCMSSAVAGHRRAFGEDIVPGIYEDFEQTDLMILVGSNTAWCHPVLFQRMEAARYHPPTDAHRGHRPPPHRHLRDRRPPPRHRPRHRRRPLRRPAPLPPPQRPRRQDLRRQPQRHRGRRRHRRHPGRSRRHLRHPPRPGHHLLRLVRQDAPNG